MKVNKYNRMIGRIPQVPPEIEPVPTAVSRPLWSVMIPAYNCTRYLAETLSSVLEQAPDPGSMQIEVIDDCSTDGDVAALVQSIGKGRVGYYRQPENVGSLRNFETCLNRSVGHYVHLLHGDDLVRPGFYAGIGNLFSRFPEVGAAFSRFTYINDQGRKLHTGALIQEGEGVIDNWLIRVASSHGVQPPAIVIKRTVYEQLGGYYAVHYGEDWEMWVRIAKHFPVAYTPQILAAYRVHPDNISSHSFKSGQSLADISTVLAIIGPMIPEPDRKQVIRAAKLHFSRYFANKAVGNFWKDRKKFLDLSYSVYKFDRNFTTIKAFSTLYLRYQYARIRESAKELLKRPPSNEPRQ